MRDRSKVMTRDDRLSQNRKVSSKVSRMLDHVAEAGEFSGPIVIYCQRGVAGKVDCTISTGPLSDFRFPSVEP